MSLRARLMNTTATSITKYSLHNVQRKALNHFEKITYQNRTSISIIDGARRSSRIANESMETSNIPMNKFTPKPSIIYDINSRKFRQCTIEDVMLAKPGDDIIVSISEESSDFVYWNKIAVKMYCLDQWFTIKSMQVS